MKQIEILCVIRDAATAKEIRRRWEADETCNVSIAFDGFQAVYGAKRVPPAIAIIDAVLPGLDGFAVIDRLRAALGERMPRVIGGSTLHFADAGFFARGASFALGIPWDMRSLCEAIGLLIKRVRVDIDWTRAEREYNRACELLRGMGMREHLRGFSYLAWAAALASANEDWLGAIGVRIYTPVADRCKTTPQSVERLIRHAVEGTMDAVGASGVYGFFGNTIDPTRGKPTNAQMIGMLAERLRVS